MATAASLYIPVYCENCTVVEVNKGEKYCIACANEVTEYLAQQEEERERIEKGWY